MKKFVVKVLTVLAFNSTALAVHFGSPSESGLMYEGIVFDSAVYLDIYDPCASWKEAYNFRLGFQGDYVFNRNMISEITNTVTSQNINRFSIYSNSASLTFNMWDRFDFFGTIGFSEFNISGRCGILTYTNSINNYISKEAVEKYITNQKQNSIVNYKSNQNMSYGFGSKVIFCECGGLALGGIIQYFSCSPTTKFMRITSSKMQYKDSNSSKETYFEQNLNYPTSEKGLNYNELQLGFGLSYRINKITPYICVKRSFARLTSKAININIDIFDLETTKKAIAKNKEKDLTDKLNVCFNENNINKNPCGYIVGFTFSDLDKAIIGFEGRFGDETALSIVGKIRF